MDFLNESPAPTLRITTESTRAFEAALTPEEWYDREREANPQERDLLAQLAEQDADRAWAREVAVLGRTLRAQQRGEAATQCKGCGGFHRQTIAAPNK